MECLGLHLQHLLCLPCLPTIQAEAEAMSPDTVPGDDQCPIEKSQPEVHTYLSPDHGLTRSLSVANIPSRLEPSGLYQADGKRPDGCSILPWRCGKVLVWDATCPDTHAPSHLSAAVRGPGVVAAQAEQLKRAKYAHLDMSQHSVPFVVETSGVLGDAAEDFTRDLGRRLYKATGEPRSREFLLQRISVAVQRGNAAAALGTMGRRTDGWE